MEQGEKGSAVQVGMQRGVFGGVVAFLMSLLWPMAGIVAAVFVGISLGRRAAAADAGRKDERPGALSELVGGVVAAPVFVVGAAAGALVRVRDTGTIRMAEDLSERMGIQFTPDQVWQFFLLGLVVAAILQVAILVGVAAASGAWESKD